MNKLLDFASKRITLQFSLFIAFLPIVLSLTIYLREASIKGQIDFSNVLLWQIVIWAPWAIVAYLSPKVWTSLKTMKHGDMFYYGLGLAWVSLHYGWFFLISSNYSPYLGMPASGYGVYPYFFIFWTLIDFIILGIVIYSQHLTIPEKELAKPVLIKLTRGEETFFCEPSQIQWLSSDNYYTYLYTDKGKFIMRKTLKYYNEILSAHEFLQIHRSTIVNLQCVRSLTKDNNKLSVVLKDGTLTSVSKKNAASVRALFKNQML